MAFTRLETLKQLLDKVALQSSEEIHKPLEILFNAFTRPEHLLASSKLIAIRIAKLTNSSLQANLTELKGLLTQEFSTQMQDFKAGNPYYDKLKTFIPDLPVRKTKAIQRWLEAGLEALQNKVLELLEIKNDDLLKRKPYEFAYTLNVFSYCQELADSQVELLNTIEAIADDAGRTGYFEEFSHWYFHLIDLQFLALRNMSEEVFDYNRLKGSDLVAEREEVHARIKACEAQVNFLESKFTAATHFNLTALVQQYKKAQNMVTAWSMSQQQSWCALNQSEQELKILEDVKALDSTPLDQIIFMPAGVDGAPDCVAPYVIEFGPQWPHIDPTWGGHIHPEDQWMSQTIDLVSESVAADSRDETQSLLMYSQFEKLIKQRAQHRSQTGTTVHSERFKAYLYEGFYLINEYAGIWRHDRDCQREFNFVNFVNFEIYGLKRLNLDKSPEEVAYLQHLTLAIERAIGMLYKVVHKDVFPRIGIGFSIYPEGVKPELIAFYRDVCDEQHLYLMIELIIQLQRFKVPVFVLDETEATIKKHTDPESYQKYFNLYGLDGLVDILLNQAGALRAKPKIHPSGYVCIPRVYSPQPKMKALSASKKKVAASSSSASAASVSVEQNYQNLLKELAQESQAQKLQAKASMAIKRAQLKKIITKAANKASKPALLSAPAPAQPETIPDLGLAYLGVGSRFNHNQLSLEAAIEAYLKLLEPLNDLQPSPELFYKIAILVELARSLTLKAMQALEDDFSHIKQSSFLALMKVHNEAIQKAEEADALFVKLIDPESAFKLDEVLSKKLDDLADHIHTTLKFTDDKLKLMQSQFSAMVEKLKTEQALRLEQRNAALLAQGPQRWFQKKGEVSHYSKVRSEKAAELKACNGLAKTLAVFIEVKIKPIAQTYAYITGRTNCPLLENGSEAEYAEESVARKGGALQERRWFLAGAQKMIAAGQTPKQAMSLLIEAEKPRSLEPETRLQLR